MMSRRTEMRLRKLENRTERDYDMLSDNELLRALCCTDGSIGRRAPNPVQG